MKRCGSVHLDLWIAGLVVCLLCAILTLPLIAQPAANETAPRIFGYDKAHEITLNGTVQGIVTKHEAGSPAGLHVLVNGPQGLVDAHLGPYMTKETQEAMKSGTPVQIVGATATIHGKEYLLARQVTFGGRQITVRNEAGFFKQGQSARHSHHTVAFRSAENKDKGGAQ